MEHEVNLLAMASGMPVFALADRADAAVPDRMKAVMFDAHGGIERLQYRDCAVPSLAPDEVLVRMHAVALNGFDPMVLRGLPTLPCPLPMVPCSDGAGEIVRCGEAVDRRLGLERFTKRGLVEKIHDPRQDAA